MLSSKRSFMIYVTDSALKQSIISKQKTEICSTGQSVVVPISPTAAATIFLLRNSRNIELRDSSIQDGLDKMEVTAVDILDRELNVSFPSSFKSTGLAKSVTNEHLTFILNCHVKQPRYFGS